MVERGVEASVEGAAPDVLDVHADGAVRRCEPPVQVWVDLKQLTSKSGQRRTYRPGGIFVGGRVRGYLWAWVASDHGPWLGVVTVELERSGRPVMTCPALLPEWLFSPRTPGRDPR